MATKTSKKQKTSRGISAGLVILCCFILAVLFYLFVLGNPTNFQGAEALLKTAKGLGKFSVAFIDGEVGHPDGYWGTIYKGGMVVPVAITLLLTVFALSIERYIAIGKAKGKGNLIKFVADVKSHLEKGEVSAAEALCSKQKGSVASVVNAGLIKYADMEKLDDLTKDQKLLSIQKEIEEATALELPTMEQNLPVIATISTLGTLFGLLGTVLGMIRSFAALATAGAPDSIALSTGISEALINTALGIFTGSMAIISYSFFTGKIDNITYAIDEIGFSIVQTYAAKHK